MKLIIKLICVCVSANIVTSKNGIDDNYFSLSTYEGYYNNEINTTCRTPDSKEHKRHFVITVMANEEDGGPFNLTGHFVDKDKRIYQASYRVNVTYNVFIWCSIYNEDYSEKLQYSYREFVFKPDPTEEPTTEITTTPPTNEQGAMSQVTPPGISESLMFGLIGGGVSIIVILLFTTWKASRKPSDMIKRSGGAYENLDDQSQAPTPSFPHSARLEETYLSPADTRGNDTETYAQPYRPTIEDMYSKPVPKNHRLNNTLYSQVLPKNERNKDYVNTKINNEVGESNYAEIDIKPVDFKNKADSSNTSHYARISNSNAYVNIAKEALNAKKERDKKKERDEYTNVFNNEQYCNSKTEKSEEYAEPAYCQINRK